MAAASSRLVIKKKIISIHTDEKMASDNTNYLISQSQGGKITQRNEKLEQIRRAFEKYETFKVWILIYVSDID